MAIFAKYLDVDNVDEIFICIRICALSTLTAYSRKLYGHWTSLVLTLFSTAVKQVACLWIFILAKILRPTLPGIYEHPTADNFFHLA